MKGEKCQEASRKNILKHNKRCRLKKLGWTRPERKKKPIENRIQRDHKRYYNHSEGELETTCPRQTSKP